MKRVHPLWPTEAFTVQQFIQWAVGEGHDPAFGISCFEDACPVEHARLGDDPKIHPMDPSGKAYSYMEFFSFTKSVVRADQMWKESMNTIPGGARDWGNWSGVYNRPQTDLVISSTFPSRFEDGAHLNRSLSQGSLTEMGRSTNRHPEGHPTAQGQSWIAAT